MNDVTFLKELEVWCIQEVSCPGYTDGNPFIDYSIKGVFRSKHETIEVNGFYDGDECYKVRFMPSFEEEYSFEIYGNFSDKHYVGNFMVTPPSENNHGPMRVVNKFHFAYEDGTPYFSIGTTCYVWELQNEQLQEITLKTLKESAFNKIRFCIFPKHYDYNLTEPRSYPYVGTPCDSSKLTRENFGEYDGKTGGNSWDFTRFNVEHFQHIEACIIRLQEMSIEADIILMHPYDRWGFSYMDAKEDDLYLKYVVARFGAFRNIWWSLANEYDLMPQKTLGDWRRFAKIICEHDPYNHLRSIHNCNAFYNYSEPWVTHCSIQRQELYRSAELVTEYRQRYQKPIVLDEIAYEGNIQHGWGCISGKEMVRRFWEASCRGGYAGHGETYLNPDNILWWSHGGKLHGESPKRLKFLYEILCETPGLGLMPIKASWDEIAATVEDTIESWRKVHNYYLYYYSFMCPSFRVFYYDEDSSFEVDVIDTWEMTIEKRGIFKGKFKINLPGKEFMAVRIRKI